MGQELIDMSAFKGQKPAQAFGAIGEQESLAEGIGSSYGILGYKGKVWTLRLRGEKYTFVRPDDGSPANHLDVIILRQAKNKSKSYYEKYDPSASEGMRPICASLNGVTPDDEVVNKQATACAICPRNAWRTNADGSKARDCTDYKRLAVLLLPSQSQQVLGAPLMEPVFLRIPPASLNNLATYGEQLTKMGWPYYAVVTRVKFDPNQPHPKMMFQPLQALTDAEAPVILPLREDQQSLRITGDDKHGMTPHLPQIGILPQNPQIAAPQPQVTAPVTPPPREPETVNTGFLNLQANPAPMQAAPVAPAAQTVADTGEPTEADEAMNARVANLLKTIK